MKTFKLVADIQFQAEDITDACTKLEKYFAHTRREFEEEDVPEEEIWFIGKLDLSPEETDDPS